MGGKITDAAPCFAAVSLLHLTGLRKQLHAAWLYAYQKRRNGIVQNCHISATAGLGSLSSLCAPVDACEPAIFPHLREGVWFASSAGDMLGHSLGYSTDEIRSSQLLN